MNMFNLTIGGKTTRSKFTQKEVAIDFDALPDASKDFVIKYGLKQYLADGVAGAESQADFDAGVQEREAKLLSGDLTRAKGEGKGPIDNVATLAKKLAREEVERAAKEQNFKFADKDQKAAVVEQYLEANRERLTEEAEAEIKARKKTAKGVDLKAFLTLAVDNTQPKA